MFLLSICYYASSLICTVPRSLSLLPVSLRLSPIHFITCLLESWYANQGAIDVAREEVCRAAFFRKAAEHRHRHTLPTSRSIVQYPFYVAHRLVACTLLHGRATHIPIKGTNFRLIFD